MHHIKMLHLASVIIKTPQHQLRYFHSCFLFAQKYQYTAVRSERHIRLLAVHKDSEGHLIGKLAPKPLDDVPNFIAISYTWGHKSQTHSLTIDGRKLRISKTAHEILNYYASSKKRRLLWIDTVCVDQKDSNDKSQQVRMMREIYNKAARVVIWLGSPPKVGPVQNLINYLLNYLSARTSRDDCATDQISKQPKIPPELFGHPYWSRVWVVQEIVAAREAVIFYNGKVYGWKKVVRAAYSLHTRQERVFLRKIIQLEGLNIPFLAGLEKVSQVDRMRRHYGNKEHREETFLPMILMKFFSSQATVKLDRIFAFLGISSATDNGALEVDYSNTVTEISKAVARYSLQARLPKLRFLYFSAAGLANNNNANWPSWVPDLSSLSVQLPFPLWDFGQYKAGGKIGSKIELLQLDQISVEGAFIDKICTISNNKSKLDFSVYAQLQKKGVITDNATILQFCESELHRYREFWKMMNQGKGLKNTRGKAIYEPSGQTLGEAFLRTLLCDASFNPFGSESRAFSERWLELINANNGTLCTRILYMVKFTLFSYFSNILGGEHHLPSQVNIDYLPQNLSDQTQLPLRVALSSFGREIAVTERGYMALVVPGVRVGDDICVFSGAATPHVLRRDRSDKDDEKYRLVGDAYIHGFMDGKWFNEQPKQRIIIK